MDQTSVVKMAFKGYEQVYHTMIVAKHLALSEEFSGTETETCLEAIVALLDPCYHLLFELHEALDRAERSTPRAPGRVSKTGVPHDDRD